MDHLSVLPSPIPGLDDCPLPETWNLGPSASLLSGFTDRLVWLILNRNHHSRSSTSERSTQPASIFSAFDILFHQPHGHDHLTVCAGTQYQALSYLRLFHLSSDHSTLHLAHSVGWSSNPIMLGDDCDRAEESVTSAMFIEIAEFSLSSRFQALHRCTAAFGDIRSLSRILSDIGLPTLLHRSPDTFAVCLFSAELFCADNSNQLTVNQSILVRQR